MKTIKSITSLKFALVTLADDVRNKRYVIYNRKHLFFKNILKEFSYKDCENKKWSVKLKAYKILEKM